MIKPRTFVGQKLARAMRAAFGFCAALLAGAALSGCGGEAETVRRAPAEGGRLVLATTLGSPPYVYLDETTGEIRGIDIGLAQAAARRLGLALEIRPMPFSHLLPAVKAGVVDFAASAITITSARARDVDFTDAYAVEGSTFLYRAGAVRPTVLRACAIRIGSQEASTSQFYLSDHGVDSIPYRQYEDALVDFERGLLDAIFYDSGSVRETVARSNGAYVMSQLFTRENYGLAVRKDFPELREALDAEIRARKEAK